MRLVHRRYFSSAGGGGGGGKSAGKDDKWRKSSGKGKGWRRGGDESDGDDADEDDGGKLYIKVCMLEALCLCCVTSYPRRAEQSFLKYNLCSYASVLPSLQETGFVSLIGQDL